MNSSEYEGDLTELQPCHFEFIASVLKIQGFEDAKVVIEPVGEAGDNYQGNVKRIVADKDGEIFKMIMKIAPSALTIRETMRAADSYRNETKIYEVILPKFTELEKEAGVPENERHRYAICYGTYMKEPHEAILMEDLSVSGFTMFDRFQPFAKDVVDIVLQNFARLHALSYALKYRDLELFKKFFSKLSNLWLEMSEDSERSVLYKDFFAYIEDVCMQTLDDEEVKNVIKGRLTNMTELFNNLHQHDILTNHTVLQQGDCWSNNILFKLENEAPRQCCLIDYQLAKENLPVADIHDLMCNCTDYQTRAEHFEEWLHYYHEELDKHLRYFDLKAEDVYPKETFLRDMKRHGEFSCCNAIFSLSFSMRENDKAKKIKEAMNADRCLEDILETFKEVEGNTKNLLLTKKVEELVKSYIELGYIEI